MNHTKYTRVVIKIGSNVLSRADGTLDVTRLSSIVDQIAELHENDIEVILVSSGAVAAGRGELASKTSKLDQVSARQLYSAVGQAKLIHRYYSLFQDWGISCGQVLTTKESLSTRRHYLNQRNCMEVMIRNGVIPIINENDTISVSELMFTDNDELSGMVSTMMDAQLLLILSNVDGIFNGNPSDPDSKVIQEVCPGDEKLSDYISPGKSQFGRGGMITKTRIAEKVAEEGVEVFIANGKKEGIITSLVLDNQNAVRTRFAPSAKPISGVKKWIAHSEGFAKGRIYINEGAFESLCRPGATSLLQVGVVKIEGEFEKDDLALIVSPAGEAIGVGKVSYDSKKARERIGVKGGKALIHYDYMYLDISEAEQTQL